MSDSMRPSIREEMAEQQATISALQRENAALREALVKVRGYLHTEGWMKHTPAIRASVDAIDALTPSAAPGEEDARGGTAEGGAR